MKKKSGLHIKRLTEEQIKAWHLQHLCSWCAPLAQRSSSGGYVCIHPRSVLPAVHPTSSHSGLTGSQRGSTTATLDGWPERIC